MMIIITGTPGTGKTTIAKALAEALDFIYLNDKEIISRHQLSEGRDEERDAEIIDEERFAEALKGECKSRDCVVDSHLSHFISPHDIDLCIVTQCELETLKQRLELRGYSEKKIRENLDSEIFEICKFEALEMGHHVFDISTEEETEESIKKILKKLKEQKLL